MERFTTTLALMALTVGLFGIQAGRLAAEEGMPWGEIRGACEKFLDVYSSSKERTGMSKKLRQQVQTKVQDQGIDEDQAMRDIMLDWVVGNQKRLDAKDRQTVKQACFYFICFIEKGYSIPGQMRDRITPAKARDLIAYLDTAAGKSNDLASR